MINRPPEVVGFAPNLDEHLVQVPLPLAVASALADAPFPDLGRGHRAEAVPPEPNRLVADVDTAFMEQILDIAKRQSKPDVHHHRKADDFRRRLEIAEWIAHPQKLRRGVTRLKPLSSDNAV